MSESNDLSENTDLVITTLRDAVAEIGTNFIGHIPYLVSGIILLLLIWLIASIFNKIGNKLFTRSGLRPSLQQLLLRLLSIAIWVFGLLLVAMIVFPGLTPSRALGGLGLLSVAIGLAFKDIFENFFAGILLLWRYPFERGDYIECEGVSGKIISTEIRMTQIRKTNGELVVVPNSFLFKNPVDVLTSTPTRRETLYTGVAYSEDLSHAIEVIVQCIKDCKTIDKNHDIEVIPHAFGESSIDIEVCWWTGAKPLEIRQSRGEVILAIKSALDNENIEIPFPYRTLTFNEPLNVHSMVNDDS